MKICQVDLIKNSNKKREIITATERNEADVCQNMGAFYEKRTEGLTSEIMARISLVIVCTD